MLLLLNLSQLLLIDLKRLVCKHHLPKDLQDLQQSINPTYNTVTTVTTAAGAPFWRNNSNNARRLGLEGYITIPTCVWHPETCIWAEHTRWSETSAAVLHSKARKSELNSSTGAVSHGNIRRIIVLARNPRNRSTWIIPGHREEGVT